MGRSGTGIHKEDIGGSGSEKVLEGERTADLLIERHPGVLKKFLGTFSDVVILILDEEGRIHGCNRGFVRLLDLDSDPTGGRIGDFLLPESLEALTVSRGDAGEKVRLNFQSPSGIHSITFRIFNEGGERILFGEKIMPTNTDLILKITELNNEMAGMTRDLHRKNRELEKANVFITNMMNTDYLTGVANRRFCMEALNRAISAARRHEMVLAIVMADLDHFKRVNDNYGHDTGDEVLKCFANVLRSCSRLEDVVARFGGEEFVIVQPHNDRIGSAAYAERVRHIFQEMCFEKIPDHLTASFGVAQFEKGDTSDSLIKKADDALYRAKSQGRNRVVTA